MMSDKAIDLTLPEFDPDKHHETWYDMMDNDFRAGDIICVGITAGRSATLSVGMVKKINKRDSRGELIVRRGLYDYTTRTYGPDEPYCTITFAPMVDSANRFSRWTGKDSTVGPEKIVLLQGVTIGDIIDRITVR